MRTDRAERQCDLQCFFRGSVIPAEHVRPYGQSVLWSLIQRLQQVRSCRTVREPVVQPLVQPLVQPAVQAAVQTALQPAVQVAVQRLATSGSRKADDGFGRDGPS